MAFMDTEALSLKGLTLPVPQAQGSTDPLSKNQGWVGDTHPSQLV